MEATLEYWPIFVAIIAIVDVIALAIYHFCQMPTSEQLEKVSEWLLYAVTQAEIDLGSGTGALKLRQVYDLFVSRFPTIAKHLAFSTFSDLVDDALEEMREMIEKNHNIKDLVEGGKCK